ncbi:hypothetical protein [Holdemania massiliensis]|uniref:hypothetical protein n=1 Tax=Holdemania massiliensis TaxID=1468449 RepID=UPI001F06BD41|nr:hypothetical protein [Holdemania massiliensis]MCH1941903.1 hypothetical protein [Holdemania massiliensis]
MNGLKKGLILATAGLLAAACQTSSVPPNEASAKPSVTHVSDEPESLRPSFSTDNFLKDLDPRQVLTLEYNDLQRWIVDVNGNSIEGVTQIEPVLDLVSGKTTAYRLIQATLPDVKSDGQFRVALTQTALADSEGHVLQDFAQVSYAPEGFLNYVIQYQQPENSFWEVNGIDPEGALLDRQTGEVILKDVVSLHRLSNGQVLCLNADRRQVGLLQSDGSLTKTAVSSLQFVESGEGWSLWRSSSNSELHDDQGEILWKGGFVQVLDESSGHLWLCESEYEKQEILIDPFRQLKWEAPAKFVYADDELAVVGDWTISYGQGNQLIDLDGKQRAEGYVSVAANPRDGHEAQNFLMVREDTVDKLNRSGELIQSQAIPGIQTIERMEDGLFKFTVVDGNATTEGLIDDELQILIPAGQYSTISLGEHWNNQEIKHYPYFICWKYVNYDHRADIYNLKLEKIAENVAEIGDLGVDRLLLIQGFEGVLLDQDGHRLSSISLFTDHQGD